MFLEKSGGSFLQVVFNEETANAWWTPFLMILPALYRTEANSSHPVGTPFKAVKVPDPPETLPHPMSGGLGFVKTAI